MRDFQKPGRSAVVTREAMAATSHPSSTLAAIRVLEAGGNALDAAIAACAVQCVVEPGSTGIGGDCFALLAGEDGKVHAFNGSGRAPAALTAAHLREQGLTQIPRQSPHAVTVPGAVDAWTKLHAVHGRMPFAELLAPAIRLAREGYAVSERVQYDWGARDGAARRRRQCGAGFPARRQAVLRSARCIASRSSPTRWRSSPARGATASIAGRWRRTWWPI